MFGLMMLKLLPLFKSIINCETDFVVDEKGVLKFLGDDLNSYEWIEINFMKNFTGIHKESFEKLKNAKKLSIKNCDNTKLLLDWMSDNIPELEELHLSHNQPTSLPGSIGDLVNLTVLHLNYNRLTSLPKSFENMIELTLHNLQSNPLLETTNYRPWKN